MIRKINLTLARTMRIFLFFIVALLICGVTAFASNINDRHQKILKIPGSEYLNRQPGSTADTYSPKSKIVNQIFLSPTSTVIFEEDFEGTSGFPPVGWKTVNADGGGTSGPWFQGNTNVLTSYSGSGYAAANYQGANDFFIDEWLISPRINSIGANDTLTFWHRSPDYSSWADSIEVRISTTDTAMSSFILKIDYFKSSTEGWAQKKYALKNYVSAESNIYIAFRYLMYNGGLSGLNSDYVGIDLVQIIRPLVANDMKVESIDMPTDKTKIVLGNTFEPTATFQNAGSAGQSNIPVLLRIYPPSGSVYENNQIISSLDPLQTTQMTFGTYTPMVAGVYSVRAYALLSNDQNTNNDSLSTSFTGSVLLSGTFTVGAAGDIPTLKEAVDTLNNNIISDDISFLLIDTLYTETPLLIGPLEYSSTTNRISIKPASGISPTININASTSVSYGVCIYGASNITFDGSHSVGNSRDMTINVNGSSGMMGILIQGSSGSYADSNTIKNLKIRTSADSLSSSDGYFGILLYGYGTDYKDAGNRISNCDITKHGAVGIATQWQNGAIIENNFIHDWIQKSGENDVHGIWLSDGTINSVVSDNIIAHIQTQVNYTWAYGLENSSGSGSNAVVYNNMIHHILSSGSGTNANRSMGIYSSNILNSGDSYYYNSIYLEGTDLSTSSSSRTAGFEFAGGSNIVMKNNIVFNETNLSGTALGNKAYCIYLNTVPSGYVSNNNDLYSPSIQGVIGYNAGNRTTLPEWQNSFSPRSDSLSLNADPFFISKIDGDLHIQQTILSPVNGAAVPISGITQDIDGEARNIFNPDIGADEFMPGGVTNTFYVEAGWNLISLPLEVNDYRKSVLFPSAISAAFKYSGSYQTCDTLKNGIGYWLKFSEPESIKVTGTPKLVDTISVFAGWNLIGSINSPVETNAIIQLPDLIVASQYFSYADGYFAVATLQPGKSYWIKAKQDGKLVLISP